MAKGKGPFRLFFFQWHICVDLRTYSDSEKDLLIMVSSVRGEVGAGGRWPRVQCRVR